VKNGLVRTARLNPYLSPCISGTAKTPIAKPLEVARSSDHFFMVFIRHSSFRFTMASVPYKRFAKLQDEFFAVSKQMRDTKNPEEKMKLLKDLQVILKESQRVLEEIHKKQASQK
jgi:hypothetical protein